MGKQSHRRQRRTMGHGPTKKAVGAAAAAACAMSVFASTAAASISTVIPPSGTVAQHAFGRQQQDASCSQVGRNCMWQLRGGDASPSNLNDTLKDALHNKDNDSAEPTRKKKKRTKKR
eukprot:scaffold184185_cov27-Attheya_sp.AAC.1